MGPCSLSGIVGVHTHGALYTWYLVIHLALLACTHMVPYKRSSSLMSLCLLIQLARFLRLIIRNKVQFLLIYRDNFSFEDYEPFLSWLRANFSLHFNASTYMKMLASSVSCASPVINSSHYFAANSHDPLWWSHNHLEFVHIHTSLFLPQSFRSALLTGVCLVQ